MSETNEPIEQSPTEVYATARGQLRHQLRELFEGVVPGHGEIYARKVLDNLEQLIVSAIHTHASAYQDALANELANTFVADNSDAPGLEEIAGGAPETTAAEFVDEEKAEELLGTDGVEGINEDPTYDPAEHEETLDDVENALGETSDDLGDGPDPDLGDVEEVGEAPNPDQAAA